MRLPKFLTSRAKLHGQPPAPSGTDYTKVEFPLHTVSEPNQRDPHWAVRAKRVRHQRNVVLVHLLRVSLPELPVVVTLTRIGKRTLDDDNLRGATLKAVRDEVAARYGVDDADPRIVFRYEQEKGEHCAVRIELRPIRSGVCDG